MEESQEMISEAPEAYNNDVESALTILLADNLREEAKNLHTECINTLKTLILNIINNPEEEKYRRIRKKNSKFQRNVGQFENAMMLLSVLGFESVEEIEEGEPEDVLYLFNYEADTFIQAIQAINNIVETVPVKKQVQNTSHYDNSVLAQAAIERANKKKEFLAKRHEERLHNPNFVPEGSRPVKFASRPFKAPGPVKKAKVMTLADLNNQPAENPRPVHRNISDFYDTNNVGLRAFELTNEYRKTRGLPPLVWDERIAKIGEVHSKNMGEYRVPFSHEGFKQRCRQMPHNFIRGTGENVAMNHNFGDPGKVAVDGWIKSPGHRKNLEGNFKYMGIGVYRNNEGRFYLTQMFVRAP